MDEKVIVEVEQPRPSSLADVIAGLKGFGIEEFEEILTITVNKRAVRLRISNLPTEDELMSLVAADEFKGHAWIQRVKCELLSRAISWLDGVNLRTLAPTERFVTNPKTGMQQDVQVVLRDLLLGWGQEVVGVLWKVLMVHSQRIQDRLVESFPDAAVLTEVEKRFLQQAMEEIESASKDMIRDAVDKATAPEEPETETH